MISEPTPATISIIITLSWSVSSVRPNLYCPAESHVHEVVVCALCAVDSPSMITKATIAAANETNAVAVEK